MVSATSPALDRNPTIFCDSRGSVSFGVGCSECLPSGQVGGLFLRVGREDRRGVTTEHDRIEDAGTLAVASFCCYLFMRHGSQRPRSFETDAPHGPVNPLQAEKLVVAHGRAGGKQSGLVQQCHNGKEEKK